ncbi:hypothetical protein A9Q84_13510 [Halobacteriovorax marinus]|uniref:Phosphoribosylformylglycinamidine synthase subunit PurL n=1 Tax=Halobacteriovorax marinus TaxID=97084 RepID=A0A1Y5F8S7_9BACT|nr:hypothetical protein A9Q84_13510 [Halobacteriovorax marinus]
MKNLRVEVYPQNLDNFIHTSVEFGQLGADLYLLGSEKTISSSVLEEVFVDTISQKMITHEGDTQGEFNWVVEVLYRPGVTDNCAKTSKIALSMFDITSEVTTGKIFFFNLKSNQIELSNMAKNVLGNPLIQYVNIYSKEEFIERERFENITLSTPDISTTASIEVISLDLSDVELVNLSSERCLALNLEEMQGIANYYRANTEARLKKGLPAWPTDVELECLAQTWSEHCKHKIFNADIEFKNSLTGETTTINSLFKTFIRDTTLDIEKKNEIDWLISIFHDNAGVVRFDDNVDICFKVETHNSPSALDPYGGALTGILGVNRDILGCGLGAKPVANTNVFCFGPWGYFESLERKFVPKNLLRPEHVFEGVHKGVEDGGNKSGIPTINGAMNFHPSFSGKPLVYVGSLGVMPQVTKAKRLGSEKEIKHGDFIYMAGGRVGADGIHGATFSSMDLNESSPVNAVQIGDPITQKRLSDFLLEARDLNLFQCVTDNGAGGLSSSVGEMAELCNGATVYLDRVPLKYPGLTPWEIFVSESQERMTFAVNPKDSEKFEALAKKRNVEVSNIGDFNGSGSLELFYQEERAASLSLDFLHEGIPTLKLQAEWSGAREHQLPFPKLVKKEASDLPIREVLATIMAHGNIASKEEWIRQYDHEVGGNTTLRPLEDNVQSAVNNAGAISLEKFGGKKGNSVALGLGFAPSLSPYDPELMAKISVDEAVRNIICHGANPKKIAVLDNFCWPDPVKTKDNPEGDYKLAQLVLSCQGLREACMAYGTPLISGKDSMKNDYRGKNNNGDDIKVSILPTLLVSSVGQLNTDSIVKPHFDTEGSAVFLLGDNSGGLLGSIFSTFYQDDKRLPLCHLSENKEIYDTIYSLIESELVSSCHDVSEGGLLTTLSEACFANRVGFEFLEEFSLTELFNESGGQILISVKLENVEKVLSKIKHVKFKNIGNVQSDFTMTLSKSEKIDLTEIFESWISGVRNFSKGLVHEC